MDISERIRMAIAESRVKLCVGYPWWLRLFLARDVVAITLGRRIYVRGAMAADAFERLMRHELAHVRQVSELGLLRFLWRYLAEFAGHWVRLRNFGAAYMSISFEIEARQAEESDLGSAL
ncbi:MAG TPA: DUF4157 domain-containing protein [Thermoanaerobaculia bacterium]|jgi:muconolactone delta-isomerase